MRHRLLALDLDGTLLGEGGRLDDDSRRAVATARRHGLRVVLCTGRRFRTAEPIARELDLDGAIVVHNGVLVKDIASGHTLHHDSLHRDECRVLLPLLEQVGAPMLYVDAWPEATDILLDRRHRPHEFQREYLESNGSHMRLVDDLCDAAPLHVVMLSLMGDDGSLLRLRERSRIALGERVRTNLLINSNFRGHILEFLSAHASKWTGLLRVAAGAGIAPEEIAAVGDDTNDIEMLRGADLGIAMGNAVASVREVADQVVAGNLDGGLAEAVRRVLDA